MKSIIVFIFIVPFFVCAQIFKPFPNGLSVELSASYPRLDWEVNQEGNANGDRKEFWIKPNFRIGYSINLYNNLFIQPFSGYISFGGKSEVRESGYEDQIVLNSVELGAIVFYRANKLEFGVGTKWNKHLNVTQKHYGYAGISFQPRKWEEDDVSSFFQNGSFDWGIRFSFILLIKINVSAEYWASLHDIESDNLSDYISIRSEVLRFGVGYNF